MRRVNRFLFCFSFVFVFLGVILSQTTIPKTVDFLFVNPSLSGGTVISDQNIVRDVTNCYVYSGGKTFVILEQGFNYIIKFNNKLYYPNGDETTVPYACALYLGDKTWLNTADLIALKNAGIKFEQYLVTWPKD